MADRGESAQGLRFQGEIATTERHHHVALDESIYLSDLQISKTNEEQINA
jgi:hypothetical protein